MTMKTKLELVCSALKRYLKASKEEKTKILDELTANMGMERKSVIRSLGREQRRDHSKQPPKRGRKETYGPNVTIALEEVWEISRELCAERLRGILEDYVTTLQRFNQWSHSKDTTELLLKMSMGTLKNRIGNFKKARSPHGVSTTKPALLKEMIPVRTGPWENPRPGDGEIDTVVHCGSTLIGSMAYTVNYLSIATGWTEAAAQMDKGQIRTRESIKTIRARLPFPMTGLDPDSGSEFINWHCKEWCDEEGIELTRSRPNHKNDNAHIEQKNYSGVRKLLGYSRIETEEAVALMNELYAGPWRLYFNFYQPVMKCIEKKRVGSKYVRKYDEPKTPYQRVLLHKDIPQSVKDELTKIKESLNPLQLKKEVDTLVTKILKTARR